MYKYTGYYSKIYYTLSKLSFEYKQLLFIKRFDILNVGTNETVQARIHNDLIVGNIYIYSYDSFHRQS